MIISPKFDPLALAEAMFVLGSWYVEPGLIYDVTKHPLCKIYLKITDDFIRNVPFSKSGNKWQMGYTTINGRDYEYDCSTSKKKISIKSESIHLSIDKETGKFIIKSTTTDYIINGKQKYNLTKVVEQFFKDLYRFKQVKTLV